jgi:hypothetical protein
MYRNMYALGRRLGHLGQYHFFTYVHALTIVTYHLVTSEIGTIRSSIRRQIGRQHAMNHVEPRALEGKKEVCLLLIWRIRVERDISPRSELLI